MGQADKHQGNPILMADYTPGSAVTGGNVIVSNDLVGIAERDIAASELGALAAGGAAYKCVADAAIAIFTKVWWDDTNNKVTETSPGNEFFGITLAASTTNGDVIPVYHMPQPLNSGLVAEEVTFTEAGSTTYTGSVTVPAGATIVDVIVHATAVWDDGTSATMKVGDATDDDGIFTGINVKATDLTIGQSINFDRTGGKEGAYLVGTATHWTTRYLATARVISGIITTGGQDGTAGRTRMIVVYAAPSKVTAATGA